MSRTFPIIYLARLGETAWTINGQHTGLTDLPLTEVGECNAPWLKLTVTWSNGIMANTRAASRLTSCDNVRTANCLATAVREASRRNRSLLGQTV